MKQFKKGQIVYVSNNQSTYILHHFEDYKPVDPFPYKTSYKYQNALKGKPSGSYRYCLSVEEYQYMINQPKDKDLVWAWDDEIYYTRAACFYDARNNRTFHPLTGRRRGFRHNNYEVIPRDQWPEWAVYAYEELED